MNTVTIKYTYGDAEITVQYANEDERKEALIEIKNLCKYFDGINQPAQEKVEMPEDLFMILKWMMLQSINIVHQFH